MAKQGQNEGVRVLDDFICEAIPSPTMPQMPHGSEGRSEGMLLSAEIEADAAEPNKNSVAQQKR